MRLIWFPITSARGSHVEVIVEEFLDWSHVVVDTRGSIAGLEYVHHFSVFESQDSVEISESTRRKIVSRFKFFTINRPIGSQLAPNDDRSQTTSQQ